jgi:hypothetical protein
MNKIPLINTLPTASASASASASAASAAAASAAAAASGPARRWHDNPNAYESEFTLRKGCRVHCEPPASARLANPLFTVSMGQAMRLCAINPLCVMVGREATTNITIMCRGHGGYSPGNPAWTTAEKKGCEDARNGDMDWCVVALLLSFLLARFLSFSLLQRSCLPSTLLFAFNSF